MQAGFSYISISKMGSCTNFFYESVQPPISHHVLYVGAVGVAFTVLLFTHVCPATGFCRCCAFQIGKICCQNCIVRNFQFRKFLPVNSYPLSFIPSARQNVNEIFLIKITPFLHSKKRRHCKQVRRFLPDIGCWLSTDTEKIPAENLGQFVTECNASRNFE